MKEGYGTIGVIRQGLKAHRVSFMINVSDIPERMHICHKCDNRICVNPDHLFLGTHHDNVKDCKMKGRMVNPVGEHHGQSKLKTDQVIGIKKLLRKGVVPSRIITDLQLNISLNAINSIKQGLTWRHIT